MQQFQIGSVTNFSLPGFGMIWKPYSVGIDFDIITRGEKFVTLTQIQRYVGISAFLIEQYSGQFLNDSIRLAGLAV
jgi:hypothetical protein